MQVIISFDEDLEDIDIIDVPSNVIENLESVKESFLIWLFDEKNNHKYWIIEDNIKKGCSYGTEAFIEWLNTNYLLDKSAYLVTPYANKTDMTLPVLYF